MNKSHIILGVALGLGAMTFAHADELYLYAGAGLKNPTQKIITQYEKETGNKVIVEYAGMGQLLTRFETTKKGDLFLSGSENYVQKLQHDGYIQQDMPIVLHVPVMAVRRDKAQNINSLKELAHSDLRIGIGDSKAMALGKGAEKMINASGYADELNKKIVTKAATVKQLMLYLLHGQVDAAVIGRAGAYRERDKLKILPSPVGTPKEKVTIALLKTTTHPQAAEKLMQMFTSPNGIATFTHEGFLPIK
ncbi:molybdate ABC transporter substrate-binding protein [Actinobacillus delphinicola]|nr:molybdate ABC transporter substrate-binding protein [Actinobacillus delphinicola]MDG6898068.1 molybdate ABC transporter substrate-binding protein [Actinobacillus delphinicola]